MSLNPNMDVSAVGSPAISLQRRQVVAQKAAAGVGAALNIEARIILFLGAHILLGLMLRASSIVSGLHAAAVFGVGMYFALFDRRLERVAYVAAYIVGAEVLWHMTSAPMPWEFGKYSIVTIFLTSLAANRLAKVPALPMLYFVLLVPSVWITFMEEDWTSKSEFLMSGRDMVSFNMSGPLALMVSAWFLSHLKLSTVQVQVLFLAILGPIIGISTLALSGMAGSDISFGTTSNASASGGFGPNQVSSVLGLGALLAFLFYILSNRAGQNKGAPVVGTISWVKKFLMIVLMIVLVSQSALTFSRGGLYNTGAALAVAFFYLIRESRSRVQFILVGVFLLVFSGYVLLPRLNQFTGGALLDRLENTSATGREDIMAYQMKWFGHYPVFGLGPGRGFWGASHTEYTRLLADHGMLGGLALVILFVIAATNLRRARTMINKAVVASLLAWSFVFMAHAGMRLAAPSFMIGLSCAAIMLQKNKSTLVTRKRRQRNLAYKNLSLPDVTPQNSDSQQQNGPLPRPRKRTTENTG